MASGAEEDSDSGAITEVLEYASRHAHLWRDRDDNYWFQRLVQEVGEAGSVLAGDHKDSLEHELKQIASIAINWLRLRESQEEV